MKADDTNQKKADEELAACQKALSEHRIIDARRHLHHASHVPGLNPDEISQVSLLHTKIETMNALIQHQSTRAVLTGFGVALFCYLLLGLRQPDAWGVPLWAIASFLLVPIGVGLTIGRMHSPESQPKRRYWKAFTPVWFAMALYTGITLIVLRTRFNGSDDVAQTFLIWCVVTGVFSVLAGAIAGTAGALAWRPERSAE